MREVGRKRRREGGRKKGRERKENFNNFFFDAGALRAFPVLSTLQISEMKIKYAAQLKDNYQRSQQYMCVFVYVKCHTWN